MNRNSGFGLAWRKFSVIVSRFYLPKRHLPVFRFPPRGISKRSPCPLACVMIIRYFCCKPPVNEPEMALLFRCAAHKGDCCAQRFFFLCVFDGQSPLAPPPLQRRLVLQRFFYRPMHQVGAPFSTCVVQSRLVSPPSPPFVEPNVPSMVKVVPLKPRETP